MRRKSNPKRRSGNNVRRGRRANENGAENNDRVNNNKKKEGYQLRLLRATTERILSDDWELEKSSKGSQRDYSTCLYKDRSDSLQVFGVIFTDNNLAEEFHEAMDTLLTSSNEDVPNVLLSLERRHQGWCVLIKFTNSDGIEALNHLLADSKDKVEALRTSCLDYFRTELPGFHIVEDISRAEDDKIGMAVKYTFPLRLDFSLSDTVAATALKNVLLGYKGEYKQYRIRKEHDGLTIEVYTRDAQVRIDFPAPDVVDDFMSLFIDSKFKNNLQIELDEANGVVRQEEDGVTTDDEKQSSLSGSSDEADIGSQAGVVSLSEDEPGIVFIDGEPWNFNPYDFSWKHEDPCHHIFELFDPYSTAGTYGAWVMLVSAHQSCVHHSEKASVVTEWSMFPPIISEAKKGDGERYFRDLFGDDVLARVP